MHTHPAPTREDELEHILVAAHQAAPLWARMRPTERAGILDHMAKALEEAHADLILLAMEETNLPEARLQGELKRTAFQLRFFGEVLRDGGYLDVRIDHADPEWPMGVPRPDLRRMKEAIGPVVVFAASNFPFAFSVAGGDTASALAAGNTVIVKAHSGHPKLSHATAELLKGVLEREGMPKGILDMVMGTDAGRAVIQDPRVKAAGFTGSIAGGRALFDLAQRRPDPIPFYGELGSTNPVFVTPGAAQARGSQIVSEFLSSFTMGCGQFCTKPGMIFVPASSHLVQEFKRAVLPAVHPMLNGRILEGFSERVDELMCHASISTLNQGEAEEGPAPTLFLLTAAEFQRDAGTLQEECFGPAAVIVEYEDEHELPDLARLFVGQLTVTLHAEPTCHVEELVAVASEKAGRILWNQWPTGVSVTYAQQHGGPYPATTAPGSTSVGTAAIERFLRPVSYQGFPNETLPEALRDENPWGLPRLVDGSYEPAHSRRT